MAVKQSYETTEQFIDRVNQESSFITYNTPYYQGYRDGAADKGYTGKELIGSNHHAQWLLGQLDYLLDTNTSK